MYVIYFYFFFIFLFNFFKFFSSNRRFVETSAFLWQIWDYIFKTVFPKVFVLFCNLQSKMSRNMCKWRHKVRNGPIFPPWSPTFWNNFFWSIFTDNLSHFFHNSETTFKRVGENIFFYTIFLNSYIPISRISRNMCKWRHKFQNVKALVPLLPCEIKLDVCMHAWQHF